MPERIIARLDRHGVVVLDTDQRRIYWDHPVQGRHRGPRLPAGRTVRTHVTIAGVGRFGTWIHLTPKDPAASAMRSAYRRKSLSRRRRARR